MKPSNIFALYLLNERDDLSFNDMMELMNKEDFREDFFKYMDEILTFKNNI